jgi:hypothetical protein
MRQCVRRREQIEESFTANGDDGAFLRPQIVSPCRAQFPASSDLFDRASQLSM